MNNGRIWAICYIGEIAPEKGNSGEIDREWETNPRGVTDEAFEKMLSRLTEGFPKIAQGECKIQIQDYSNYIDLEDQFKAMVKVGALRSASGEITQEEFKKLVLADEIEIVFKQNPD